MYLKKNACISFDKFQEICRKISPDGFAKLIEIEDCANFLYSIGVILWHYKNEELRNWVILKPEWAVNAVYKIIDDGDIQDRRGHILAKDFTRLWKESYYENKHTVLKKMLEVFKIAFPKKDKIGDYIIPARLPSMPIESRWKDDESYLRLEYRYEFMPKGMVNQISADLSRYIISNNEVWNNAVNFKFENNETLCQVEEDFHNRKISIKAKGRDARGLIIMIKNSLEDITDGYKGVVPQIYVPCNCSKCENSNRPTTFLYDDLLRWSANKDNASVTCNESGENMSIDKLLYNVGLPNPSKEKKDEKMKKTIKIFLASSSELKEDREKFEQAIRRKNDIWLKKGIYLEPIMWENFIDSMSQTRLQDEYNKAAAKSNIFVMLFWTKVGIYTAEEFEKAFGKFKETGKPRIYTYFKNAPINPGDENQDDTNSRFAFQKKLRDLGHYQTVYKNTEGLILHFFNQLEKLEDEGFLM
jgi:internalin A